jgi:hypothetical protein
LAVYSLFFSQWVKLYLFFRLGMIAEENGTRPKASGRRKTDSAESVMKGALAARGITYDPKIMDVIREVCHYLDVWHKCNKIVAKVLKVGRSKRNQELISWTQAIRNHFWYCAKACDGDSDRMKELWIGLLHHVAGEHSWRTGKSAVAEKEYLPDSFRIIAPINVHMYVA